MKRTIYLAMGVGVAATVILLLSLWSGSSVIVPQVLAAAGDKGAEFFDNPFPGVIQWEDPPNADICLALVSPPDDDINDFIRINPNGETLIKIAEHPATLILTMASGQVLTGTGQFTATFYGEFGGKNQSITFTATGRVSDGLITLQAVCNFTRDSTGVIRKNAIDLR